MKSKRLEDDIIDVEWLEFKHNRQGDAKRLSFVNIRRDQISEVLQCIKDDGTNDKNWCRIVMKNGKDYLVKMSYEKVMELV